jgi:ribosome biogenesis GTPase
VADDPIGALAALGWSPRVEALYVEAAAGRADVQPGRVVRVERVGGIVALPDGTERLVGSSAAPAVGDWVVVGADGSLEGLDRWSALVRADPTGVGDQVLAANVDLVAVTVPADRASPARVEREVAVGWESGARPIVVLTKADLAPDGMVDELRERLVGVDVLATSAAAGTGVDDLRAELRPNRTMVFLGPSGAGKSTLANALVGATVLAVGAVRDRDQRGRHTTTSRQLLAVPGGGVLIDTPGLRSLGLTGDEGIVAAFPEIDDLATGCRFRDCAHGGEPGCAVAAAIADGTLDPARFASYRKLTAEMAAAERRSDPLLRKATLSEWKARIKAAKAEAKRKGR